LRLQSKRVKEGRKCQSKRVKEWVVRGRCAEFPFIINYRIGARNANATHHQFFYIRVS